MTSSRTAPLRFGLFDWLDENRRGIADGFDDRLAMLEYADEAGFYCYHLAEHHGSTLSTVPSPNLFLAAAAERTTRLRLGPLTYVLPLYHPLRLLEEIAMLDQLSHGRLEVGLGRGAGPDEGRVFGVTSDNSRAMFQEALDVILMGLSTGELNYHGQFYTFDQVKTHLRAVQRPYPPLWYPTSNMDSIPWLAGHGMSAVFSIQLADFEKTRTMLERYVAELEHHRQDANRLNRHVAEPFHGISVHVHVAETDQRAQDQARAAWATYFENFTTRYGKTSPWEDRRDFDKLVASGRVLVGSPDTVRRQLAGWVGAAPINYFAGCFSFGSLSREQILTSLRLFATEVMPAFSSGD